MKILNGGQVLPLVIFILLSSILFSQSIVNTRESDLMPGGYTIDGKAFLEEYDNGELFLRLSDDYSTPSGPDVQIFLANDPQNVDGAFFIEDLGESGHFDGAKSWNLGTTIDIDSFDYIIFRCVAFGLHWANGNFGDATDGEGNGGGGNQGNNCKETTAATTDWATGVDICPSDGQSDVIPLRNTLAIPAGDEYAYVLTDIGNNILKLHFGDSYDFEGSGSDPIRVFGISYDGNLSYEVGSSLNSITSDGCIIFSDQTLFLTVTKNACEVGPTCLETNVATTNWVSQISICPSDGQDDNVMLQNNALISAGETYAYVFADENRNIKFLYFEDSYNFEGSGEMTDYVYGLSYSGTLSYNIGDNINTITADGCAVLSSSDLFLTVTKDGCVYECVETVTATTDWVSEVEICPTDGVADVIPILNNLFIEPGGHYAFIITDENGRIQFVISEGIYDFEGSGSNTNRVYGISYDGTLTYNVGDPYTSVTADGCAILSGADTFLTIIKMGCAAETASISGSVRNQKGEGVGGVEIFLNTGATQTTNSDGGYTFSNLPLNKAYTLTPSKEGNILNGVSAQDLVIMSRHILGLQSLANEYLIIAADANKDQKISALDIINFLNLIIGRTSTLASNINWRFVPSSHSFDSNTPYEFFEKDVVQNLTEDVIDMDFIGVKVGDVSGNASPE